MTGGSWFQLKETPGRPDVKPGIRVVASMGQVGEGQRCSLCRLALKREARISLGGGDATRVFHRSCLQAILEWSHEVLPDVDPFALRTMKKAEMEAAINEFIDESTERIRKRELERRGLA